MVVIGGCDALPPNLGKCRPDGRTITRIAATNSINERAIKSIAILRGLFSGARFCEKSRVAFACGGCWYCEVACIASLLRPPLAHSNAGNCAEEPVSCFDLRPFQNAGLSE